ncbi:class II aldolase/adducin family protein [Ereboglobus luteus]|uniref:Aldolase n=1 Tax=Ereboglobus luteus TaxID=1796921 RepID=A0A2U8E3N5_9BACT|nr:class II aldolase/adducin family protein [Ereboglobus luteus]AWI09406.1 aldolase [Ereboglobus luteus]
MASSWLHPRDELVETMRRIYRYKMTTTSGGNLSIRDADGGIWITPARVDKGRLNSSDIVCVRPDGTREGLHPPSSEFPFHREIYRRRPDIKAIVHAHPGALVAFSICRLIPDTRVQVLAHAVCGKIAYAAYACPGSEELGRNIAETFAGGADCVMLENHGVVIGGRDLKDAFQRFETLEYVAQTLCKAAALGKINTLTDAQLVERALPGLAELPHAGPTSREKELRTQICDFVQRSYRQRLLTSTVGSYSARLAGDEFVITPRRRDRLELEPSGMVRATINACEAGKRPSRAALLHALIYQKNPDVGAVINAQPAHASAFCMTDAALSTRTIPESFIMLNDVPRLRHACVVADAETIAAHVSLAKRPVILIENEGALVVGKNVLDAFDRLEVLEATCEALFLSRPLGPLVPMPDAAIDELKKVFGVE